MMCCLLLLVSPVVSSTPSSRSNKAGLNVCLSVCPQSFTDLNDESRSRSRNVDCSKLLHFQSISSAVYKRSWQMAAADS